MWISINEGLPKIECAVMVTTADSIISQAAFVKGDFYKDNTLIEDVISWKYLKG